MKKILPALLAAFLLSEVIYSQASENKGTPIAEVYSDFHYSLNDTTLTTGFGVNKAYFGYNYLPGQNFSATLILNIGTPEDLADGASQKRYAYFREASIAWIKDNLSIKFGMTTARMFDYQQKFWGKRYLAKSFESLNDYGNVADLGFVVDYKINDLLKADVTIMNGEGYSNIQDDNNLLTSFGLTITPGKQISIRLYGDIAKPKNVYQSTFIGFIGYKNDHISIGTEIIYKNNHDLILGHDAWGISGTGAINISKKTEIFTRYDFATSVTVPGENIQWNYLADRSFAIIGIQYTLNQNVRMALNYQGVNPYNSGSQNSDAIFLNAVFKF